MAGSGADENATPTRQQIVAQVALRHYEGVDWHQEERTGECVFCYHPGVDFPEHLAAEVVKALDEAEEWKTDLHCFTHGFQPGQICTQGCDIARVRRRVGPWERIPKGEA